MYQYLDAEWWLSSAVVFVMSKAPIIPSLLYKDCKAAIIFLCEAFGFKELLVVPDPTGGDAIVHAQLVFGDNSGMIMVST